VKWRREFIHKIIYFPLFGQEKSLIASPFWLAERNFPPLPKRSLVERFEKYNAAFLFRAPPSPVEYIYILIIITRKMRESPATAAAGELLLRAKQFAKHIENGRAPASYIVNVSTPVKNERKGCGAPPLRKYAELSKRFSNFLSLKRGNVKGLYKYERCNFLFW
jgi:hypothetical protein